MTRYSVGAALIALLAIGRVASTYTTFNATSDEPAHIACGLELLQFGEYSYELQHPPLARVAVGLGAFLGGVRLAQHRAVADRYPAFFFDDGEDALYADGSYWWNLALARIGVLPFFALMLAVGFLWGRRWFGEAAGFWGVALLACSAPVLGHAGLATTDIPCAATVGLALYLGLKWLEDGGRWLALGTGAAVGLAVLCKFSSVGFIAAGFLAAAATRSRGKTSGSTGNPAPPPRPQVFANGLYLASASFVVLWAGYGFSIAPLAEVWGAGERVQRLMDSVPGFRFVWETPLPLTHLLAGLREVVLHNAAGHDTYLLGQFSRTGWWYFFPIVLAVKTPLALLGLATLGAFRLKTRPQWLALILPAVILAVAMTSRIQVGVRHILPVYLFLAVSGGYAIASARSRLKIAVVTALGLWAAADSIRAHPDYMAHFNELAGSHPERILAESDLDWGQDLHRLSLRLKELGADHVSLGGFGSHPRAPEGLPTVVVLGEDNPLPGYIAVGVRLLNLEYAKNGGYAWLRRYQPIERIGKSIDLYYLESVP